MSNFSVTASAEQDAVRLIESRTELIRSDQGLQWITDLEQLLNMLAETPELGAVVQELSMEIMAFPHKDQIVYYSVNPDGIIVLRILDQSLYRLSYGLSTSEIH